MDGRQKCFPNLKKCETHSKGTNATIILVFCYLTLKPSKNKKNVFS